MSWTTPRTFISGEIVTAAQFNAHIRDNFLELGPAKVAAAGDWLYGGPGGLTLRRVPIGSAAIGWVLARRADGSYAYLPQTPPIGMLIFFDGTVCPTGWSEFVAARGRMLVGRPAGGTTGGTVGTAFGNLGTRTVTQVPSHYHTGGSIVSSTDGGHWHYINVGGPAPGPYGAHGEVGGELIPSTVASTAVGSHGLSGYTAASGVGPIDVTNPYIQYLVCSKD